MFPPAVTAGAPDILSTQAAPLPSDSVAGSVRDADGGLVPGATVVLRSSSGPDISTVTAADGSFVFRSAPAGALTIIVRAGGFAETRQVIAAGAPRTGLAITLGPAAINETVTVTATRTEQRMGDVPASITVIGRDDIKRSPAVVADDLLREVSTFSLFRRTSSLASHPTTQGVSLRGIGPSGVSRTLVLLDGVPFNDPFGGWVYWSRVPMESADRIEVVEGATSNLYGNYAMGGVINIVSRAPTRRTLEFKTQIGNRKSPKIDLFAGDAIGRLAFAVDASAFRTDGYPTVIESERGKVDNNASVNFNNLTVRADYAVNHQLRTFFRAGTFREDRDNGKASTIDGTEEANKTRWTSVSGGIRAGLGTSQLVASLFGDFETFRSNFLAVPAANPPRSLGRMTLNQRVPTHATGALAQWARGIGAQHYVTVGADWRWVDGDSEEDGLDATFGQNVILHRVSGGTQQLSGIFVQDLITPASRVVVTLGARLDHWRNYDGHNLETNQPSGTPTAGNNPNLPERDDTVVSPRAGALYHVNDRVTVWGNFGSGFRAPTLNELYRQFRVGAILTLPNNQLGPERLTGGDAGINIEPIRHMTWRTTYFDNRVKNPVSNVSQNQAGTILMRNNLGKTRIRGLQTDVEYRLTPQWQVSAAYLYNQAMVTESTPATLVGKYLVQVPVHRGSVRVTFADPRYVSVSVGVQGIGSQYDDDQNTRLLPAYGLVDLSVSRTLAREVDVFFAAQNIFDQQYVVGTLPTLVGSPRFVTAGVRVKLGGK